MNLSTPDQLPKITVVTVTYNAANVLEATIKSVCEQTYPKLEYVVIDGGSTDGSLDIIKKYADGIGFWVSEPDGGIYPAMNKSLAYATGEYVNFMNAGDWFASPETVAQLMAKAPKKADMIYGHHEVRYQTFIKHKRAGRAERLWRGNVFVHQSLFARRRLLQENPFDLNYPIAADFDFFFKQYQAGAVFYNAKIVVCSFAAGGASDVRVLEGYREIGRIVGRYGPSFSVRWFHLRLLWKQKLIVGLRRFLPHRQFEWLMKLKNHMTGRLGGSK